MKTELSKVDLFEFIPDRRKMIQSLYESAKSQNNEYIKLLLKSAFNKLTQLKDYYLEKRNSGYLNEKQYERILHNTYLVINHVTTDHAYNHFFEKLKIQNKKLRNLNESLIIENKKIIEINHNLANQLNHNEKMINELKIPNDEYQQIKNSIEKERQEFKLIKQELEIQIQNEKENRLKIENEYDEKPSYKSIFSGPVSKEWIDHTADMVYLMSEESKNKIPKTKDGNYYEINTKSIGIIREELDLVGKPKIKKSAKVFIPIK